MSHQPEPSDPPVQARALLLEYREYLQIWLISGHPGAELRKKYHERVEQIDAALAGREPAPPTELTADADLVFAVEQLLNQPIGNGFDDALAYLAESLKEFQIHAVRPLAPRETPSRPWTPSEVEGTTAEGRFLSGRQIDQVMDALESDNESWRCAAFEMIQELYETPSPRPQEGK